MAVMSKQDTGAGIPGLMELPASWTRQILTCDNNQQWFLLLQGKSEMLWERTEGHLTSPRGMRASFITG